MRKNEITIVNRVMRVIYTFLLYLIVPIKFFQRWRRYKKDSSFRSRWPEYFGFFDIPSQYHNAIWIHASGLGEVVVSKPLIQGLQKNHPNIPILVTTQEPEAAHYVKTTFHQSILHVYKSYDFPYAIKKFLKKVQPCLTILMETELYINLLHYCYEYHVPILVANARLSEEILKKYKSPKKLTGTFHKISLIAAQSKKDAEIFKRLNVSPNRIKITGNLKFDRTLPSNVQENGQVLREQLGKHRHIWIAASIWKGEETIILKAFEKVKNNIPDCLLIIVPRHLELVDSISSLCKSYHYKFVTRSSGHPCTDDENIYIVDTMGELMTIYAASDIALVGASFIPIGGHNILEPAAFGLPIITGKYMFATPKVTELFSDANAFIMVENSKELAESIIHLFENEKLRSTLGTKAKAISESNRGATKKHLDIIDELLTDVNSINFAKS